MRYLHITTPLEAKEELVRIGADPYGVESMIPKMENLNILVEGVACKVANIMKQEMLSIGGDVAVARGTVGCTISETDAIVMGNSKQIRRFIDKISMQPFKLKAIATEIENTIRNLNRGNFILKTPEREIPVGERTLIMGIINMTPDSFSDGGRLGTVQEAVDRALEMVQEGADILDIGGESSRPYSDSVPLDEELKRVIPLIRELKRNTKIPLSIDTTKAEVAREAVEMGVEMINDISAMRNDQTISRVIARYKVPVVLMHMRGTPKTMQEGTITYDSVTGEITQFLKERMDEAESAGIDRENIIVDPGIGFGKRTIDNTRIIKHLKELKSLGRPILIGVSRKRFIGDITNKGTDDRLDGTAAAVTAAIMNGANIVRVHDVGFMKGVSRVADSILRD